MSLIDSASLIVTPNAYKEGKLYSVIPSDGSGDMSVVRATTATRVNSAGLIESVANNITRLDYSNGTCPSLLVEPQRTNVLQRSQEFDNAYWINNGVTITANNTTAPDGTLTADRLTGVSGGFSVVRFSTWSATNKAASCFAKKNTSNIFRIANVTGAVGGVNFDLNSGVVSSVSFGFSAIIEDFGNGWYRCTAVDTLGRTGTFSLGVTSASESVFIWGAQLEAGSYPTSYIPTTSASVTRNADEISKNPSAFLGANTGSWFIDVEDYEYEIKGTNTPTTYIGDSISNYIGFSARVAAYNGIVITKRESGTVTTMYQNPLKSLKACFVWNGTSLKLFINGSNVYNDNSFANFAAWDTFELNNSSRPAAYNCNSSVLFSTAISDAEAINLTTV